MASPIISAHAGNAVRHAAVRIVGRRRQVDEEVPGERGRAAIKQVADDEEERHRGDRLAQPEDAHGGQRRQDGGQRNGREHDEFTRRVRHEKSNRGKGGSQRDQGDQSDLHHLDRPPSSGGCSRATSWSAAVWAATALPRSAVRWQSSRRLASPRKAEQGRPTRKTESPRRRLAHLPDQHPSQGAEADADHEQHQAELDERRFEEVVGRAVEFIGDHAWDRVTLGKKGIADLGRKADQHGDGHRLAQGSAQRQETAPHDAGPGERQHHGPDRLPLAGAERPALPSRCERGTARITSNETAAA